MLRLKIFIFTCVSKTHNILKTSLKYLWQIYVIQVHFPRSLQVRILYIFDKLLCSIQQRFDLALQLKQLVVDCFYFNYFKVIVLKHSFVCIYFIGKYSTFPNTFFISRYYFCIWK